MTKYIDKERIGAGTFGEVWECECDDDGGLYAKKRLVSTADPDSVKRFLREVRILGSLDHPNVVRVTAMHLKTPPYWYVMPRYRHSLRDELPTLTGNVPRIQVIFTALLGAIEYAHSEGVIHRDLKPENVLMNSDTDLVVSDFGLGRVLDSASTRRTDTGFGMGTLPYMAPEQLTAAREADVRSDVYSLGRMLYELYTETLTIAPQELSRLTPGVGLVVGRATQARPENRYQTVGEMKKVWLNVVDAARNEAELVEFSLLLAQLASSTGVTVAEVERLATLLAKRLPDDDLVHKTLMELHPDAVLLLYMQNPEFTRELVARFSSFTADQSWGWSYTDGIGNVCRDLFATFTDPAIRADLLACAVQVGVGHNRYHVMQIAEALLAAIRPGEALVAAERLERVPRHVTAALADWGSLNRFAPELQRVIREAARA